MSLNELAQQVHELTKSKGFWPDGQRSVPEVLLLIVSEATEAMEEYRKGRGVNETYWRDGKPEGIPTELADVLIRVLDACAAWEINIDKAFAEKMECNRLRPHRHGKKF